MTNDVKNNIQLSDEQTLDERTVSPFPAHVQTFSCAVAAWSVLAMGLHLWPFEGRHSLEVAAPVNLGIILWTLVAAALAVFSRPMRRNLRDHLPSVCVWAFLAVAAVSVAFSPDAKQSAMSLAKLALMYVGAFALIGVACERNGWASRLCILALIAACVAMASCVVWQAAGYEGFGFFANPYKYGTATAILSVLGIVWLALRHDKWSWLVVPVAVLAAVATVSLGGLCGVVVGLIAGIVIARRNLVRLRLAVCLLALAAVLAICWQTPFLSPLRDDVRISEPNGQDVRQRYIEWQAQLNLLEARPVAGTGLGCANEYRSAFYGRLPKLNTLAHFDRNGWLLTAAETGIFGLTAFVWLIVAAGRKSWRAARTDSPHTAVGAAAFAALAAACAANTFSAVNYNGVLNAFVLVLALAHYAGRAESTLQHTESVISANVASACNRPEEQ